MPEPQPQNLAEELQQQIEKHSAQEENYLIASVVGNVLGHRRVALMEGDMERSAMQEAVDFLVQATGRQVSYDHEYNRIILPADIKD